MENETISTEHNKNITTAWFGVLFAILFPTIVTWIYFILVADAAPNVQRSVGLVMKVLQFGFPAVWAWAVLKEQLGLPRPTSAGVLLGVLFGLAVTLAGWLLFHHVLEKSPAFTTAAGEMRAKFAGFGVDSLPKYVLLGIFYAGVHSLLEEYYWRWFVFGQLRRLVPVPAAIVISALGFMAHHVLVVATYFGATSGLTWLFSGAVAVGGAFWAWLYNRSGSLYGPWLSHLVVDAGIFLVGYRLVRGLLTGDGL